MQVNGNERTAEETELIEWYEYFHSLFDSYSSRGNKMARFENGFSATIFPDNLSSGYRWSFYRPSRSAIYSETWYATEDDAIMALGCFLRNKYTPI